MDMTRLRHTSDEWYQQFAPLYQSAFPEFEKRTLQHQQRAFDADRYFLQCYHQQGQLIGFIGYWEFEQYCYIEHYAISEAVRGQGYGSKLLQLFLEQSNKTLILEIDPVEDDKSARRLRFYQALGFVENSYDHSHPPYQPGYSAHSLRVLSSEKTISPELYHRFNQDLEQIVMAK